MCVTFFINAYKQHRRLLCVLSPRNGNKDLYEDEDMRFNVPQILEFSAFGYLLGQGPTIAMCTDNYNTVRPQATRPVFLLGPKQFEIHRFM